MFEITKTWYRWTSRYNTIIPTHVSFGNLKCKETAQNLEWDLIPYFLWFPKKTFLTLKTKSKPVSTHVLISTIKSKSYKSKLVYILWQINTNSVVVCLDLI